MQKNFIHSKNQKIDFEVVIVVPTHLIPTFQPDSTKPGMDSSGSGNLTPSLKRPTPLKTFSVSIVLLAANFFTIFEH